MNLHPQVAPPEFAAHILQVPVQRFARPQILFDPAIQDGQYCPRTVPSA
jgi:hypothetical protein